MSKKVNTKIIETNKFKKDSNEFTLIKFINSYPKMIIEEPINSISQKLAINTSTLTRMIRKIGFKNYASFRDYVIEKLTKNKKYTQIHRKINNSSNALQSFLISSIFAIEHTFCNIEEKKFESMINEIVNAKKIFLFGMGFPHLICHQLSKYFKIFNINNCNILNFYHALRLVKNSLKDDLWIIISIFLTTKETIFLLKKLSLNNHKIILITSNYNHILLKNTFYTLKLKSLDNLKNETFKINYNVVLTAVANLIINCVSNKINYDKVKEILMFNVKAHKWKK